MEKQAANTQEKRSGINKSWQSDRLEALWSNRAAFPTRKNSLERKKWRIEWCSAIWLLKWKKVVHRKNIKMENIIKGVVKNILRSMPIQHTWRGRGTWAESINNIFNSGGLVNVGRNVVIKMNSGHFTKRYMINQKVKWKPRGTRKKVRRNKIYRV